MTTAKKPQTKPTKGTKAEVNIEAPSKYFPTAKATCACGAVMVVGSTMESIDMEICSQCHPLFTGKEKAMDMAGRVERFKARQSAAKPKKAKK